MLTASVMEKEIVTALKGIGDTKSPRIDGYRSYFFKKAWNIIRTDVVKTIQYFFCKWNNDQLLNRNRSQNTMMLKA